MNNISINFSNQQEISNNFKKLEKYHGFYKKYSYFLLPHSLILICPLIQVLSLFFNENRINFIIYGTLFLIFSWFFANYLFNKKITSAFSFFSLKNYEKIEKDDVLKFFAIYENNKSSNKEQCVNDTIFYYLVQETIAEKELTPYFQKFLISNIDYLDLDVFRTLKRNFSVDFFKDKTILSKLFYIQKKEVYNQIVDLIDNHQQYDFGFKSLFDNFDYFIDYYSKNSFTLSYFKNYIFKSSIENKKLFLDYLNLFIKKNNNYYDYLKDIKIKLEKENTVFQLENF